MAVYGVEFGVVGWASDDRRQKRELVPEASKYDGSRSLLSCSVTGM